MHANHAFQRAFRAEHLKSLTNIERRANCGDQWPVASEIGSLMSERDQLIRDGFSFDADILNHVIDELAERLQGEEEFPSINLK